MLLNPQFTLQECHENPTQRDGVRAVEAEILEIQTKFSPPSIPNSCIPPKKCFPEHPPSLSGLSPGRCSSGSTLTFIPLPLEQHIPLVGGLGFTWD